MNFCWQIYLHGLTCQNKVRRHGTHLFPVYAHGCNSFINHFVSRGIVVGYQTKVFPARQPCGTASLHDLHNIHLPDGNINFSGMYLLFIHCLYNGIIQTIINTEFLEVFACLFRMLTLFRQKKNKPAIALQPVGQLRHCPVERLAKVLTDVGILPFVEPSEIEQ